MIHNLRNATKVIQELRALDAEKFNVPYARDLIKNLLDEVAKYKVEIKDSERTFSSMLIITDIALSGSSTLLGKIAETLYGDPLAFFDVRDRLRSAPHVIDALWGAPPGYEPEENTLSDFIEHRHCGVVVFDDFQAFDPSAIRTLAQMCDTGKRKRKGPPWDEIPVDKMVVLATARVSLPSIRNLELVASRGRGINGEVDILKPKEFSDAVLAFLNDRFPEHFSPSVWFGFQDIILDHIWQYYVTWYHEGRLDSPLLDVTDPNAIPWNQRSAPTLRPAKERDLVDNVLDHMPEKTFDKSVDIFISYRTRRNEHDAVWLSEKLQEENLKVWIDKESLNFKEEDETKIKGQLIKKLVASVRAARCTIAFAADMVVYQPVAGLSEEEAIHRGLAMRQDNMVIKWNWQKLEIDNSRQVLILDTTNNTAYAIYQGKVSDLFGRYEFRSRDEQLSIVRKYLEFIGELQVGS